MNINEDMSRLTRKELLLYLNGGGDKTIKNQKGDTLLHLFTRHAAELLGMGLNANALNNDGLPPLFKALESDVSEALIQATDASLLNRIYRNGETILTSALSQQVVNIRNIMLLINKEGIDLNMRNEKGKSPIEIAYEHNLFKIVNELINKGSKFDQIENADEPYICKLLRQKDGDVTETIIKVLERSEYIDYRDKDGNTLLHMVVASFDDENECNAQNKKKILEKLLQVSNINAQNNSGETPLNMAIKRGRVVFVKFKGQTPCLYDRTRLNEIAQLLRKKPNMSIPDREGNQPIHNAASRKGMEEVVEILIRNNVDVRVKNKQGKMPENIASEKLIKIVLMRERMLAEAREDELLQVGKPKLVHRNRIGNKKTQKTRNRE